MGSGVWVQLPRQVWGLSSSSWGPPCPGFATQWGGSLEADAVHLPLAASLQAVGSEGRRGVGQSPWGGCNGSCWGDRLEIF